MILGFKNISHTHGTHVKSYILYNKNDQSHCKSFSYVKLTGLSI